jgi:7-cyano-7-deazaguanine synthase in queuosine biosynthesis
MVPETVIVCGGAQAPRRPRKTLRLARHGPDANVSLESEDVGRRMLASLPGTLADLLEVATYVYAADRMVVRGGETAPRLGADWRRNLRFIIPVRETERWSAPNVKESLERLLGFMSEDSMRFEFVAAKDPPAGDDYFDFGTNIEEVVLFSGGLDSLTGAVDRLSNDSVRLLLVSHQSSTKIANRQKELARDLAARFPGRIVHVPVRIRMRGTEGSERTQRTRSFLFGALGAAVARIAGVAGFSLFENGIVSFNLPIASQIVGAAATRTTHPRVIRHMSDFLSLLLGGDMRVSNPYLWMTKGEVAARLRDLGHADLARYTVSCSAVYWMTRFQTHCGRCSQCLDRRFGTLAAGLGENDPVEMYETDLLTGAREVDLDRTMAEAFVRHALELDDMTERTFFARFGGELARTMSCIPRMTADAVALATLDLHHRHAVAVRSVLEDGYRRHARELAGQSLPPSCILRLVAGPEGVVAPPVQPFGHAEPHSADARDFRRTSEIRIALDPLAKQVLVDGFPPLEGAASFAVLEALVAAAENDRGERRAPENFTYVGARKVASVAGLGEASLRSCIYRIRKRLASAFEASAGIPLSADALIQNHRWQGYRLNPAVLILAPEEIAQRTDVTTSKVRGHSSTRQRLANQ